MKKLLKSIVLLMLAMIFAFSFVACSSSDVLMGGPSYGGAPELDGTDREPSEGEEGGDETENENQSIQRPAGLITAAAWDDNENYLAWLKLFDQGEPVGKFFDYSSEKANWGFNSLNRVSVEVKRNGVAVEGALVYSADENNDVTFKAKTNANGMAYLFPNGGSGEISVAIEGKVATKPFDVDNKELLFELSEEYAVIEKATLIELMFVIDVTGSMGDELIYLQNEIADVIHKIAISNEQAQINLALLFYRDHTDKEVFAYHDFVNVIEESGMNKVQYALSAQYASGGGDYEEAVDEALDLAVKKQWSERASTKIIFHVLDAPPHSNTIKQIRFNSAVTLAAEKGIRICPIICSGTDKLTEYLMRQASIYTGGTFVFITDDSGIGNPHYDPQLPNATVEALNSLMVRLVNGYYTGEFKTPVNWRDEVKK